MSHPVRRHNWGVGDSAASAYSQSIDMVECRNLKQLGDFVHGLCEMVACSGAAMDFLRWRG